MRWRRKERGPSEPSEDARAAVEQMERAMVDTDRLIEHVREVSSRAHEVADSADRVRAQNHFADAVRASMRRAQHP